MDAKHYVYWNLHKRCYSLRLRGRVVRHFTDPVVLRDVEFRVSEKGRQRVIATRRKTVHAYIVCGTAPEIAPEALEMRSAVEVTYNPYRDASFVTRDSMRPIARAGLVCLSVVDGRPKIIAKNIANCEPMLPDFRPCRLSAEWSL